MSADLAVWTVEIPDPNGWEQMVEMYVERILTEDGAGVLVSISLGNPRGGGIDVSIDQAEVVIAGLQRLVALARHPGGLTR